MNIDAHVNRKRPETIDRRQMIAVSVVGVFASVTQSSESSHESAWSPESIRYVEASDAD